MVYGATVARALRTAMPLPHLQARKEKPDAVAMVQQRSHLDHCLLRVAPRTVGVL